MINEKNLYKKSKLLRNCKQLYSPKYSQHKQILLFGLNNNVIIIMFPNLI